MNRRKLYLLVLLAVAGCGGDYILTASDHIAPVGGEALAVARLQRREIYRLAVSIEDAPVEFRLADGQRRVAYTDNLGYAASAVPAPKVQGKYRMSIFHQDSEGDVVTGEATIYAWDADRPVVAVDFDFLPPVGSEDGQAAKLALSGLARQANLIYMTRRPVAEHRRIHDELDAAGRPDGPVLPWQRQRWHVRHWGRFNLPKIVIESRLVSQLVEIRRAFPHLRVGVCGSELAAAAFREAGLESVIVGSAEVGSDEVERRKSWAELAERGI
ncbi:MAG: hypothetical protein ACYTF6_06915 [Planctomycetota bacterium]|jgi:hypothetical protein